MDAAIEELRFVSQSENRVKALIVLTETEPITRDDLETRLGVSHRTVIRVVNTLTDRGYVRESEGGLRLTPFGAFLATCLDAFVAEAEIALEYRPLLEHGPPLFREMDLRVLAGAELVVASESKPFAILDRLLDLRAEGARFREIAPGVEQKSLEQLARRVRSGEEIDVEVIIPESASVAAESQPKYREDHAATLESDQVDIYVHQEPIRFAAGVVDDTAAIAVMRDGQPYAIAISDAPEMRTWVENVFEQYRREATLKTEI